MAFDMNMYMKKRYAERRARALRLLGGECAVCGAEIQLELDHIHREDKEFDFSKIWNRKLEVFDEELKKAQILCTEHHIEKTRKELSVGHGEGSSGKKNCKCSECKKKKTEYMKKYYDSKPDRFCVCGQVLDKRGRSKQCRACSCKNR